ncbi:hypothetical protein V2J09_004301 [Rumex salicifolius]
MDEFMLVDGVEGGLLLEVEQVEERDNGVVRWEEFMPKMMIRVLLVEADDSTRQIIAALLRKCNYKVAAVPDGLKAWEVLKRRHNNIDLILTEVDLPSISGYALLTLIMEHDSCRNIPVIMMSSSDSMSTVFQCMLKGAADFLIKPVRRNELQNLWQHVWRKISANRGTSVQNIHAGDCKAEASSKNGATRICSDDYISSSTQRSEPTKKASNSQGSSQMRHHGESNSSSNEVHQHDKGLKLGEHTEQERSTRFQSSEGAYGDDTYASTFRLEQEGSSSGRMAQYEIFELASCVNMDNMFNGEYDHTTQAVDLIGNIDNHCECTIDSSTSNREKNSSSAAPQLELSLRRSNDPDNQGTDGKKKLNHSNASAFSSYSTSKNLRTSFPSSDHAFSSDEENRSTVMTDPTLHPEKASPVPQVGLAPTPGNHTCPIYVPTYASMSSPQTSQGAIGLNSNDQESSPFFGQGTNCSGLGHSEFDETSNNEEKLTSVNQQNHATGSATQSANSTLCGGGFVAHLGQGNDYLNQHMARKDNGEEDEGSRENGSSILTNEQLTRERSTHHQNPLREAALAKFRLKRKERCYEKKVRYQSRKRLAEQRPRVKGQFVRQVQTDQPLADTYSRHEDDGG